MKTSRARGLILTVALAAAGAASAQDRPTTEQEETDATTTAGPEIAPAPASETPTPSKADSTPPRPAAPSKTLPKETKEQIKAAKVKEEGAAKVKDENAAKVKDENAAKVKDENAAEAKKEEAAEPTAGEAVRKESAQPTDEAGKSADDAKRSAESKAAGGSISLGSNPMKNVPEIVRVDDDSPLGDAGQSASKSPIFYKGSRVKEPSQRQEKIQYVYLSRGAWLIKALQPFIDRLAVEVIRSDSSEVTANFIELTRTYAYLCALIATDDGSDRMLKKIGEGVAIHRKAASTLRLVWTRKDVDIERIFSEYLDATFFKHIERDAVRIPAGSLSVSEYSSLSETYKEELKEPAAGGESIFPPLRK